MFEQVLLIGNLGNDPEMKYLPSGKAVTNFSMATSESWTSDGEKHTKTKWWRVAVFGKSAEACNNFLKKGSRVLVEGKMTATPEGNPRVWNDQSGNARASFEITAEAVKFLSPRGEGGGSDQHSDDSSEDEIPF